MATTTQRGLLTSYTYDLNGNRTSVETPAGTTTYTYDDRNRLITATADGTTSYSYYPDGKKETVRHPNGTQATYSYDDANRIVSVLHSRTTDAGTISSYSYAYDANNNRTEQTEVQNGVSETTTYSYDALNRLKDFTVTGTGTTITAYSFEGYNRKTETVTADGAVTKQRTYHYDETDWLTGIDDSTDADNAYTIAYSYDNNGNTLTKSNSSLTDRNESFAYDALNRLVETKRGPPDSQSLLGRYDYNAAGLRVRHRNSSRGDVDYYYDESAVIEEHDATDDSLLAHYRYADQLISLDTGSAEQYYHHDAMGSTVNLTEPDGTLLVSYRLDPWGHIRNQTGTSVNRQIFTGQEHDTNTGLIYFGARYYDPDTARFITQDTYLGRIGTPPSLNRYLYAYANPTAYVDPNGNFAVMAYLGWTAFNTAVDTLIDYGCHKYLGGEGDFNWGGAIAQNFALNFATGGIGGKLKRFGKIGYHGAKALTSKTGRRAIEFGGEVIRGRMDGLGWSDAAKGAVIGRIGNKVAGRVAGKALGVSKKLLNTKAGQNLARVATKITGEIKSSAEKFGLKLVDKMVYKTNILPDIAPEFRKYQRFFGSSSNKGFGYGGGQKLLPGPEPRKLLDGPSQGVMHVNAAGEAHWELDRVASKGAMPSASNKYVYDLKKGEKVVYRGITDNPQRRLREHSGVKDFDTMEVKTDALKHDQAVTIEAMQLRKDLAIARAKGQITGYESIEEQLRKAGLQNKNRGRIEENWIKGLNLNDYIKENPLILKNIKR